MASPGAPGADLAALAGRLAALAEGDPMREVCGLVVAWPGGGVELVPVRNAAGDATGDPGRGRHAFLLDPVEQLSLERRVRAGRGRTVAAYHSHVDGPAELSAVDREALVVDGVPVLPGADHVVIGCSGGKAREIRSFRWDGSGFALAAEVRLR